MMVGFDDDLAGDATSISSRMRGLLTGINSALESVQAVGEHIGLWHRSMRRRLPSTVSGRKTTCHVDDS